MYDGDLSPCDSFALSRANPQLAGTACIWIGKAHVGYHGKPYTIELVLKGIATREDATMRAFELFSIRPLQYTLSSSSARVSSEILE